MANISIFFTLPLKLRYQIYAYLLVGWHEVATPSPIDGLSAREYSMMRPEWCEHPCMLMEFAWADFISDEFALIWLNYPRNLMETSWADRKDKVSESDAELFPMHDYSILRVSRQLYEEASEMLYDSSIFAFHYAVSDTSPKVGDLERNLYRVRQLDITISEGLFERNLTSVGITHILQEFARRATSLQSVMIRFLAIYPMLDHSIEPMLHDLFQGTALAEMLCAFNVTEKLLISMDGRNLSFPCHDYEQ